MNEVVTMKDMKQKDTMLERRFDRYFDGAQLPPCDLTEAKRVVSARARNRKRGIFAAVSSLVAVCAGLLIFGFVVLFRNIMGLFGTTIPGDMPPSADTPGEPNVSNSYLLSETSSTGQSFSDLNGKYAVMNSFAPFSLSNNADAEYTLYFTEEKEVLLRAELRYSDGYTSFRATVWCDLTEGEYVSRDFEDYRALIPEGSTYGRNMEYINGEYVSHACMISRGTEYVIDMTSPSREALEMLVSMLRK